MPKFNYEDAYGEIYHGVGAVMDKIEDGLLLDPQQIRMKLFDIMTGSEDILCHNCISWSEPNR